MKAICKDKASQGGTGWETDNCSVFCTKITDKGQTNDKITFLGSMLSTCPAEVSTLLWCMLSSCPAEVSTLWSTVDSKPQTFKEILRPNVKYIGPQFQDLCKSIEVLQNKFFISIKNIKKTSRITNINWQDICLGANQKSLINLLNRSQCNHKYISPAINQ